MPNKGIHAFRGQRILLLQGPVGPFFQRLARDLERADATVFKVNFNAGDWFFYRRDAVNFRGPMSQWPSYLADLLERLDIDLVLLFGDCRGIHQVAREVAEARGIQVGVFEEGYLRPHFVTLEPHGVNAHSLLPRNPVTYLNQADLPAFEREDLGNPYWYMVWWGFWYFLMGSLGAVAFPHYRHHRRLSVLEVIPWLRSVWRKHLYAHRESRLMGEFTERWDNRFFLVPLQVFNDSQVVVHSDYSSVQAFIEEVMTSFALHAPQDTALVIKHHPMDRGYTDYSRLIRDLARRLRITNRCYYVHDQHMPTLLRHARGVVVINSTTALQSLQYGVATKVMGRALFDLQGLCHKGTLDQFWNETERSRPQRRLLNQFVRHLVMHAQINGNFYRAPQLPGETTGLRWHGYHWRHLTAHHRTEASTQRNAA
ncbi:MAG: capsule biosynthesis protein [Hydrogenophaga sp.]|uniref:capsule biosynthesis protein n=1 Tax=Hydrogenophaga sp. TaxID=1904254 RepID=UPI003D9BD9A1